MIVQETFYNIKCDSCGCLLDDENWYSDKESLDLVRGESGWKNLGGKNYCRDCWYIDDDDNITTKDGYKFTEDGKEIFVPHLDYLKDLLDERLTITQIRTEIIKAIGLYHRMVGTLYKNALVNDIDEAFRLLEERKKTAPQWQLDCYNTFTDKLVFYNMQKDGFPENICNIY